jgi:hypothetical protein
MRRGGPADCLQPRKRGIIFHGDHVWQEAATVGAGACGRYSISLNSAMGRKNSEHSHKAPNEPESIRSTLAKSIQGTELTQFWYRWIREGGGAELQTPEVIHRAQPGQSNLSR